jgi:hypothetical protein
MYIETIEPDRYQNLFLVSTSVRSGMELLLLDLQVLHYLPICVDNLARVTYSKAAYLAGGLSANGNH